LRRSQTYYEADCGIVVKNKFILTYINYLLIYSLPGFAFLGRVELYSEVFRMFKYDSKSVICFRFPNIFEIINIENLEIDI
jgi:hypothetical protein